jgi:hypothetical protein
MSYLDESRLYTARIAALVERDAVAHALYCRNCHLREAAKAFLAFLGWTADSFLEEAFPEFYGDRRG